MLWLGFLAVNVLHPEISDLDRSWPPYIQNLCQCVILIRSGVGMNIGHLKNLKGPVLFLTFGPLLCEWVCVAVTIKYSLTLPWDLALAAAFMLAAVSPAIIIPVCLELEERGYGKDRNIQELLIGVTAIDTVTGIVSKSYIVFGILSGIALSSLKGSPTWFGSPVLTAGLTVPIIVLGGLGLGTLVGFILRLFRRVHWIIYLAVLGALSLTFIYVTMQFSLSGLSYIAILLASLISIRSRSEPEVRSINRTMMMAWRLVEVILFGLAGAVMDISKLQGSTVGYALLVVLVGLLIKVPVSMLTASVGPFTLREKIHLTLCRIPKATVQASLGGVVLALAQAADDPVYERYGSDILTTAAVAIIATTPLALVIMTLAPCLLTQTRSVEPPPAIFPAEEVLDEQARQCEGQADLIGGV